MKRPDSKRTAMNETPTNTVDTTDVPAAFRLPRPSRTLSALTTSALALPGIAGSARADAPIERAEASFAYSYYKEDDLERRKVDTTVGSRERYEVHTKQARFDIPTSERTDIGIDVLYEEMSGASPWYVRFDPGSGSTLQVMSGATIDDQRTDVAVDLDYYMDNGKDTFKAGFSNEKDYLSIFGGLGLQRHFNDKNTTLDFSGTFAYDWIEPTGGGTFERIDEDTKWSVELFTGLSQIVSRNAVVQFSATYKHSEGFLNDPYKLIQILGPSGSLIADGRPETREQGTLMVRYRHHFEKVEGSAHLDYRFYADDWGVVSHTIELGWYQRVTDWLTITPSARWYSQSKADFYEPFLDSSITPATAPVIDRATTDSRPSAPYRSASRRTSTSRTSSNTTRPASRKRWD